MDQVAYFSSPSRDHLLYCSFNFSSFRTLFCAFWLHLQISAEMQLIGTTSPLPTVQIATIYRPIYVLKRCSKSGETLQTCPDLYAIISRNFDFRVFELIFYDFWVLAPQSCNFHWHFGISMCEKNLSSIERISQGIPVETPISRNTHLEGTNWKWA